MLHAHQFVHERLRAAPDEEDLIMDPTGLLPEITSRAPPALRDRFLQRLAKLIAATTKMVENDGQPMVELHVSRNSGSPQALVEKDKKLQAFLESMARYMAAISKYRSGTYTSSATWSVNTFDSCVRSTDTYRAYVRGSKGQST
jgi:hypothetical protein